MIAETLSLSRGVAAQPTVRGCTVAMREAAKRVEDRPLPLARRRGLALPSSPGNPSGEATTHAENDRESSVVGIPGMVRHPGPLEPTNRSRGDRTRTPRPSGYEPDLGGAAGAGGCCRMPITTGDSAGWGLLVMARNRPAPRRSFDKCLTRRGAVPRRGPARRSGAFCAGTPTRRRTDALLMRRIGHVQVRAPRTGRL